MRALIDPGFMATRAEAEADFRAALRGAVRHAAPIRGPTWPAVQPIDARDSMPAMALLEGGTGVGTTPVARRLAAVPAGRGPWCAARRSGPSRRPSACPNTPTAVWPAVQSGLFAERPVYPALEQVRLEWWLSKTREWLTVDDPRVARPAGQ